MKLVALVRKPNGKHESFEADIDGKVVYYYCDDGGIQHNYKVVSGQDAPVIVDAPEDIENLGGGWFAVDAPEDAAKKTEASLAVFHSIKTTLKDRLVGKGRDGIVIESLEFRHQEPHPEIAPFGEINVGCRANYKGSPITVTAMAPMNRDFIANYLEKLIWERLEGKKRLVEAALGMQFSD